MLFPGTLAILSMGEVQNFFKFGLLIAMWAGLVLGLLGFGVAFIQHRHGQQRMEATASEKRMLVG